MKIEKSTLERIIKEDIGEELFNSMAVSFKYKVSKPRPENRGDGAPKPKEPGKEYEYKTSGILELGVEEGKPWEKLVANVMKNGDFTQEDAEHMVAAAIIAVTGNPPGEYQPKGGSKSKGTTKGKSKGTTKGKSKKTPAERALGKAKRLSNKLTKLLAKHKKRMGEFEKQRSERQKRAAQRAARLNENKISIKYTLTEQSEPSREDIAAALRAPAGLYQSDRDKSRNRKNAETSADSPVAKSGKGRDPESDMSKGFQQARQELRRDQWAAGRKIIADAPTMIGSQEEREEAFQEWYKKLSDKNKLNVAIFSQDPSGAMYGVKQSEEE